MQECVIADHVNASLYFLTFPSNITFTYDFLRRVHILYVLFMCELYIISILSCHLYSMDFIFKKLY